MLCLSTYDKIARLCALNGCSLSSLIYKIPKLNISRAAITNWKHGAEPRAEKLLLIAEYFGVPMSYFTSDTELSDDTVITFPVIGEIAAGYNHIAEENWSGETISIPLSNLKGHAKNEFFVLSVSGNSMFPMFQDGDKVLILKQEAPDFSGQICAVIYDNDYGTLKRMEYAKDWINLVPINPSYPNNRITGDDMQKCKVVGIPKLLIREIL